MKALKWIGYFSAMIGLILVVLGSVAAVFHLHMLQVNYMPSYFQAANSFFLITVVIFLYSFMCRKEKE